MHLTFWSIAAPVLFWGGLYFVPLPRALKIVIAIFVLAVGWSGYASAFEPPVGVGPVHSASVSGNVITFNPGTLTSANVSAGTFGHVANGAAFVESAASFRTAGGSVVPVVARSAPSALAIAKTIGTGIALVSNVGTALVVGVALYEFAKQMGFDITNPGGVLTVQKATPGGLYKANATPSPLFATPIGAATWACTYFGMSGPSVSADSSMMYCENSGWNRYARGLDFVPGSPTLSPATVEDFEIAIASQTDWPATSKIDEALRDAVKAGAPLALPKPAQITGPLEVSYPPTTVTNPDGSRTITTKKETITYGPDGAIKVDTETTVKTFDAAGTQTGTSVITESPKVPEPEPQTDCEKVPDALGCIKLGEAPAPEKLSKTNVAVSVVAQSFSGGGSCPSPLSFTVIGHSYAVSYQPLCDRLIILKALFMAMAGVMAAFILADSFKV